MFIKYFTVYRVLFLIFLTVGSLHAGTTGKLAGRVTIKGTGEPMIGANVLINETDLGAATDAEETTIYCRFLLVNMQYGLR